MADNKHYTFLQSRSGQTVPALILPSSVQPLHSTVDPVREAQRLVSTIPENTGFVIFLGLGGGFAPEAALNDTAAQVVVIDFNAAAACELFATMDYTKLQRNERFSLLIDPQEGDLKKLILEQYKPALHGGIKVIPLRPRTEADKPQFEFAAAVIQDVIKSVLADYSVQAHFGRRWFSNIIRNVKAASTWEQKFPPNLKNIDEAAIIAAGPSLDHQIDLIGECKARNVFLICSDTALPVLLHNKIEPDAVVSIDCQHISYHHFIGCRLQGIPLFLDIASPPLLCGFSDSPLFFSSGHPLALYITRRWRPLPLFDTSGGNVTYACLSLAEMLKARRITLFGADFSCIRCRSYARGAYIYPVFEKKQNRLSPMESLFSSFLYRSPFLPPETPDQDYRETSQFRFYRQKLEEKAVSMSALITAAEGPAERLGAPLNLPQAFSHNTNSNSVPNLTENIFNRKNAGISGIEFLEHYKNEVAALPTTSDEKRDVFTTLLPLAAALKKQNPALKTSDLIQEAKDYCIREIDKVLADSTLALFS